jgi:hypothetical protein
MSRNTLALSPTPSWVALAFVMSGATLQVLLYSFGDAEPARDAGNFWTLMTGMAWSWWVHATRRRLGHGYAFEFDALVFFAWLVVVPYFLLRSRKALNLSSALAAWCIYVAPIAAVGCSYALLA